MKKRERVRATLERVEVTPSKRRGQNFLSNPEIIRSIVRFGGVRPGDPIVEIGPGLGALTAELLSVGPVSAIEIEPRFCAELRERFPALTVCEGDARVFDLSQFGKGVHLYGNVPYSYSTEILFNVIEWRAFVARATLLLQREFVERMAAPPGSKTYGILSVMVQLVADVALGPTIGGGAFTPPTKVESRVVRLDFLPNPRCGVSNLPLFRRVVRAAFAQRRRMIGNSIRTLGVGSPEELRAALVAAGIEPTDRAERVGMAQFARLTEAIEKVL